MKQRDPAKLYPHDRVLARILLPGIPFFVQPNHLTVLRFFLTPVVLWLLWAENYAVGVPLFIFAAFTDMLDGTIARVRKQITPWGTFYDPVADKLLVGTVILLFVTRHMPVLLASVMLTLEILIVTGGFFRKRRGRMTSANIFGKTKMVLQVTGLIFLLFGAWFNIPLLFAIAIGVFVVAVVFAILSLFTYGL